MTLTAADDLWHTPTDDDRWWSETYWFSFDDPKTGLSGTFYPLLRQNLDIAALVVAIWAPDKSTAWMAPYSRSLWHLKPPEFVGKETTLEGLTYTTLEDLNRYRVRYEDKNALRVDLDFTSLSENHVIHAGPDAGHWDQPMKVTGWLELQGKRIELNCTGMRDRSWGPRPDDQSSRATYIYGINENSSFLVLTRHLDTGPFSMGYLDQDGKRGKIVECEVIAERDEQHRMTSAKLVGKDDLGRRLNVTGTPVNHLAKQANPAHFAWMSMIDWDFDGGAYGQFQDVYTPDVLSEMNTRDLKI